MLVKGRLPLALLLEGNAKMKLFKIAASVALATGLLASSHAYAAYQGRIHG
jgi:hypothetical protein